MNGTPNHCKLFIPSKCLAAEASGLLLGHQTQDGSSMCITTLLQMPVGNRQALEAIHTKYKRSPSKTNGMSILGIWDNQVQGSQHLAEVNTCIKFAHSRNLPLVHLRKTCLSAHQPQLSTCGPLVDKDIIVIIYDIGKLSRAVYLTGAAKQQSAHSATEDDMMDCNMNPSTNLSFLAQSFSVYQGHRKEMLEWSKSKGITMLDFVEDKASITKKIRNHVGNELHGFFMALLSFVTWITGCLKIINTSVVRVVLSLPACLCQVYYRYLDLQGVIKRYRPTLKDTKAKFGLKNALWRHLVDVSAGIAVMMWLSQDGRTVVLAENMMTWAQNVAAELQRLLDWLMGVPAGLKLNHELAEFLGKFFMYHIYLWTGYLRFLQPVWGDAMWYISLSGCLGLSVQLSLVQDLFSMMTLHIYCFYVYAARLYHLQVRTLSSLWRLFRGKKWNVLRQRVDSISYDVDQLFLGTLLFTILLFLLPTTLLFYVVFATLRVLVLMLQGTFHMAVNLINKLPVYLAFVRIVHPDKLSDNVYVYPLQQTSGQPLYLAMQFVPLSWRKLWQAGKPDVPQSKSDSWGTLGKKLLLGHLIYPWIEPAASA